MTNWEQKTNELLSDCNIMDVVAIQIAIFSGRYGTAPQLVILSRSLKGPLIREVYQAHGMEPIDSVIEPIWIGKIPMIFANMPEHFIRITNNSIGKELTL